VAAAIPLVVVTAIVVGVIRGIREKHIDLPRIRTSHINGGKKAALLSDTLETYREAVDASPRDPATHFKLGETYIRMGRYEEALVALRNAVRFDPDYAEAYYQLGVAYESIGRDDQAVEVYKQAIRVRPDYTNAYLNLGEAYVRLDDYQKAMETYREAIRNTPKDFILGDTLLLSSDPGSSA
jgi:tetratricopeptide (TPR) repeat protein